MKTEKQILEAVRVLQEANPHDEGIQNWVRNYFPELKESDDEKIRKRLIAMCKHYIECYALDPYNIDYALDPYNIDDYKEALAWLEKQNEQKPVIEMKTVSESLGFTTQKECDDYNKMVTDLIMSDDGKGGQKPANKVEPLFHEGDWVVSPNGVYWHIDAIQDGRYHVSSDSGKRTDWSLDANIYHKFTIQDAKPGDVLVNQNGEMPFIFKECKNNHIYCYCGYTNRKDIFFDRFVDSEGEELHWLNLYHERAYPATKEQRDQLEKAMADAGYTFDFEKKELKKIEQKPAWSKEDEDMCYKAIAVINRLCAEGKDYVWPIKTLEKLFYWLKSLKDRVGCEVNCTTKQQWKPSDEHMKQLGWIAKQNEDNMIGKELMSLYQDLKKLKVE